MALLLVVLVVTWFVWAMWPIRPGSGPPTVLSGPADEGPPGSAAPRPVGPAPQPLPSAPQPKPVAGRHCRTAATEDQLTEDDLIAFGLALEASEDVLGELLGRRSAFTSTRARDRAGRWLSS